MLNDQWGYVERLEKERDFWKEQTLQMGAEVTELKARLGCTYRVLDGLALQHGRMVQEREGSLRVVKGGAA